MARLRPQPTRIFHREVLVVRMTVAGKSILISGKLVRIAVPELETYEAMDDPGALIEALRNSGADLFSFLQTPTDVVPRYSYLTERDNLAVCSITTFDYWWHHQIVSETRNRIRKASKMQVVVREAPFNRELVRGMWGVYNETLVRQGKRNLHYGKDVQAIHAAEATFLDRAIFIGAYLRDQLIGFIKIITDGSPSPRMAGLLSILSMMEHRDKAPTNALVAETVRICAARGIRYLSYGRFVYGNKNPDGLTAFKKANGFLRYDLPRYYVPLTTTGRIAWQLGLHRRFRDHVPEFLLEWLRHWRSAWHARHKRPGRNIDADRVRERLA